jgi:hypothetical protein
MMNSKSKNKVDAILRRDVDLLGVENVRQIQRTP